MFKPFLTLHCRPCGQDFIRHRQGHIIRERISMKIQFGEITDGENIDRPMTDMRVEIWDIPPHLIRPDGTLITGSRHLLGLRDLLREHLGEHITEEIGSFYSDIDFHPMPEKPGHFLLDTWIYTNIALDVLDRPEPDVIQTLAKPEVSLDTDALDRKALNPDAIDAA
jgi:hypothetical protein